MPLFEIVTEISYKYSESLINYFRAMSNKNRIEFSLYKFLDM